VRQRSLINAGKLSCVGTGSSGSIPAAAYAARQGWAVASMVVCDKNSRKKTGAFESRRINDSDKADPW
jgi:hypothetical protein